MTFFSQKIPFSRPKFLMTFLLVIDRDFRIFPIFLKIFHIFAACDVVYDPFFTRKTPISANNSLMTPFLTLFVHPTNTTSQNIGGDGCMYVPSPHLKYFGGTSPRPPRSPPVLCSVSY